MYKAVIKLQAESIKKLNSLAHQYYNHIQKLHSNIAQQHYNNTINTPAATNFSWRIFIKEKSNPNSSTHILNIQKVNPFESERPSLMNINQNSLSNPSDSTTSTSVKEKFSVSSWPSLIRQANSESSGETKLNESENHKIVFKRSVKKEPLTEWPKNEEKEREDKILLMGKPDLDLFNNDLSVIPNQ